MLLSSGCLGAKVPLLINLRENIFLSVKVPANYGEGTEDSDLTAGGPGDWRCDADILDSPSH